MSKFSFFIAFLTECSTLAHIQSMSSSSGFANDNKMHRRQPPRTGEVSEKNDIWIARAQVHPCTNSIKSTTTRVLYSRAGCCTHKKPYYARADDMEEQEGTNA